MNQKRLYRWELALMVGIMALLLAGIWLQEEQTQLAGQMIRLHVIANSDTEGDQALKLAVRDRILEQAQQIYPGCTSRAQAEERLRQNLSVLEQAGEAVIEEQGYSYSVHAELTECWFPTKEYGSFALPAGEYTALRVVIGEGEGQNWWCVAFPPLCVGAASQTVEEALEAGYFTDRQVRLMTAGDEGYVLKFRSMELLGELRDILSDFHKVTEKVKK